MFAALCVAMLGAAVAVRASHLTPDPLGHTTVEQRIVPTGAGSFKTLTGGPGEPYVIREDAGAPAKPGRETRRVSLAYLGQLSDFQLADEESPARVEFLDPPNGSQLPFSAAWRPWEALNPQIDDATIRQLNTFAPASPVAQGNGSRRSMDFTINTGDSADSQQKNETEWVRTLLEGGPLNPGSGTANLDLACTVLSAVPGIADLADPSKYTGVQDYDDYIEGTQPVFYDPDDVRGSFAGWPSHPGLMDRAQQPFSAAGVNVPTYVVFGNHDALAQGNQAANAAFEAVATGCVKPMVPVPGQTDLAGLLTSITPANLIALLNSDLANVGLVPPDPNRRFVSKDQYKQIFLTGTQADGHGFGYIDPNQQAASGGSAGYYSWSPVPGTRFIGLDTVSEGGVAGPSADGNIDNPQFQWLRSELEAATAADELVVLFSHHAIPSLTSVVPDEVAPPCTGNDAHGHDVNPGCDVDPRSSTPIRLGADLRGLLHQYPHVVAWVAGHSHVNDIQPYLAADGNSGFWSIRTAAEADWPQQSRLLEIMDNRDGELSIFGTILDHASPTTAPPSGTPAAGMSDAELASVGRTLSYNDPQVGAAVCNPACGEGTSDDRNVELLIRDPRRTAVGGGGGEPGLGCGGDVNGTRGKDRLIGTPRDDRIFGRGGKDRIEGLAGNDCIEGNRGRDRLLGGDDNDLIKGGGARDVLRPGAGTDLAIGGRGRDVINSRDGAVDEVVCGKGRDTAKVDANDIVKGCERIRRR
jgi:metallophosphoesterase (TIGR03767 family)